MRRTLALLAVPLLALTAVACGSDDDPVEAGGDPAPPGRPVLTIAVGGGYVPFGYDFAAVPLVIEADGDVLTGGAITLEYPGPPVLPVVTGHLDEATVARLLRHARDAGLAAEELDAGQPGVTDQPSTTISVVLDGVLRTHSIYALDFGLEDPDPSLSADQLAVRRQVNDLVGDVRDAVTAAAVDLYEPTAYQVLAAASAPAADSTEEPRPNEVAWPFADLALDEATCVDVPPARADQLRQALAGASAATVWRDAAGATWRLSVRALLPGDEPCTNPDRAAS